MDRRVVIVLPGTRDTSKNIIKYLRDLDVEFKIIPVINVKINYDEVESARRAFSSGFTPEISVFTSKTAVKIVKKLLPEAWKHAEKHSLAIGPGTASLLEISGAENVEVPEMHSSEGLIKLLSKMSKNCSLALYSSKHVSQRLEEFIMESFYSFRILKLYTIVENRENVEKLIEHVRSYPENVYIIVVTCLKILEILSREKELLSAENIVYSIISKRLLSEALKIKLPVHYNFSINTVNQYYETLRSFIRRLLLSRNQ